MALQAIQFIAKADMAKQTWDNIYFLLLLWELDNITRLFLKAVHTSAIHHEDEIKLSKERQIPPFLIHLTSLKGPIPQ